MNAFVLCTGRCGSLTWAMACGHLTSHTFGHETHAKSLDHRVYPDDHIEIDNRLAWHLGELGEAYGDDAVYVHLQRDPRQVAASYARRFKISGGIAPAYASGIVMRQQVPTHEAMRVRAARAMVDTITANIRYFLRDKPNVVRVRIEAPHEGFDAMCDLLGARGDRQAAHATLDVVHNRSR